jgi:hypothetical protein
VLHTSRPITPMASIFVSYRRTDAAGHAGRLYDQLVNRFGAANIFKDLDSMEPGADFAEVIEATVARCDALIAVIGSDWLYPGLRIRTTGCAWRSPMRSPGRCAWSRCWSRERRCRRPPSFLTTSARLTLF